MRTFTAIVHKEEHLYVAQCPEIRIRSDFINQSGG
jgi:hypothetical protein